MRPSLLFCFLLLLPLACTPEEAGEPDVEGFESQEPTAVSELEDLDPTHPDSLNLQTPEAWRVRLDDPAEDVIIGADKDSADIYFVNMSPGWHITTGPAAIFYHPASEVEGRYRVETRLNLFDPQGRTEAYGLFVGGQDLQGDDQSYEYFLIRNSGEYLIKRRDGDETELLQGWTPHEAIRTYGPETETSVANELAVEVGADQVRFLINGEQVTSLPRAELQTDGTAGLRINHGLNVHVEDFSVTPLGE